MIAGALRIRGRAADKGDKLFVPCSVVQFKSRRPCRASEGL
jgi:hypothetical protein